MRMECVNLDAGCDGELHVSSKFASLVPRDGLDLFTHCSFELFGTVTIGKVEQEYTAGRALEEGSNRSCFTIANDQVSLPMPRHRTIFDLPGSLGDPHFGNRA
jgi:hypothetical protein